jgi:DNA-directed RNA polymerase subunit beta'
VGSRSARYIVNEVQKIYLSEGASINNKHIEMIVRQMFSRVKINRRRRRGSTLSWARSSRSRRFLEVNRQIKKDGLKPGKVGRDPARHHAHRAFRGIVPFAASFQDTARVLVKAAIESKIDKLRGLKENVIIGRLIPAGDRKVVPTEALVEVPEEEVAAAAGATEKE